MENRVYYGEYSLKHWVELILKKNIILPEYQRYFVWDDDDVRKLIVAFKSKLFVPPVTIGAFKIAEENQNLILDGQQRLTSVLLAFLGLFPDKSEFKKLVDRFADENDDDDGDVEQLDNIFEWRFSLLTEKGKNKEDIVNKIVEGNYRKVDFETDEKFFESTFLGFSYLVPFVSNNKKQQKYYSSVFRNINIQGKPLLPQESRDSLYFLDNDLKSFFKPTFSNGYTVRNLSTTTKIDFVRFLSLLSQYHKDQTANNVARSFKPQMEKFYEDYIYSVLNDTDVKYGKFTEIFPAKKYQERFTKLDQALRALEIPTEFSSIIDLDMYFFGLIYTLIFENKVIDSSVQDELKAKLETEIAAIKTDHSHTKSPGNLGHLRSRITSSIAIYKEYAT